jgi:hypothetical protein
MATPKTRTFSSGKAAVANARRLEAKGEISKRELRGVERSTAPHKRGFSDKDLRDHFEVKKR